MYIAIKQVYKGGLMNDILEKSKEFEATFTVSFVVYRKDDYVIFKTKDLKVEEGFEKDTRSQVSVKGFFPKADPGDIFRGKCRWNKDKTYGYSIEVLSSIRTLPSNINGIRMFLMKNVKGVGEKTVNKIVSAFGESTLDKIRDGELEHIKGISKKTRERIYNKVTEAKNLEDLTVFLYQRGVNNYSDVVEIYDALGEDASEKILSNPYCICKGEKHFPLADKIAMNSGYNTDSSIRIQMMILYYMNNSMFLSGNIFEYQSELIQNLSDMIQLMSLSYVQITKDMIDDAVKVLSETGNIVVESGENDNRLFLPGPYKKECEIADRVKEMLLRNSNDVSYENSSFFDNYEKESGIILDDIQKNAVKNSVEHALSIVTGGPGTGKTLTINAIIRYIYSINPKAQIKLCAPTGRAAKRMSEMTGMEAFTIHRLLNLNEKENSVIVDDGLDVDYVIVDESSMINQTLFYFLITAVCNGNASMILVGDKDQLPPVGAGLPFRDLINCGYVPVVRLQNLYRQAGESQININAQRILAGVTEVGEKGLQFDLNKQDFFFFSASNPEQINNLIIRSIDGLVKVGIKEDDIVVLSPMRKSEVGVYSINDLIQTHLNPASEERNEVRIGSDVFRENDRVMQTVNNYEKGVFNGDCGKISSIDEFEEEVVIVYDDFEFRDGKMVPSPRPVVYEFSELNQISLAYSTTIHKAQGSEYPCVIMPLSPLLINLSRSILYTAITRARNRFIFIGDSESLKRGILKIDETKRNTRLPERICSIMNSAT